MAMPHADSGHFNEAMGKVWNNDTEQRQEIEDLTKKVKNLTSWYDIMFGTPCEEIRHQQQVENLEATIQRLREALQTILEGEGLWTKHDMAEQAKRVLEETK